MGKSAMKKSLALGFVAVLLGAGVAYTQFTRGGGTEYNTTGVDAQHTSWVRTDRFISKEAFEKGGFKLQWKLKVNGQPRELESIVGATTSGGGLTKPLNVINTPNNTLTTVDNDTGIVGWTRHFDVTVPSASTTACPGGMTANSSRPVNLEPPAAPAAPAGGGFAGRGAVAYSSYLGESGQGIPDSVDVRSANGFRGPARGPQAPPTYKVPFGGGRFGSGGGFYVLTSDGVLHTAADGAPLDLQAPVKFLAPNAHTSDLIAIPENNDKWHSYVIYAATVNDCGGVKNGVWAINLADDAKPVTHFDSGASPIGDPAFSTDGTLFVAIGKGAAGSAYSNAIVALEPKTLTVKDSFSDPKADFSAGPTIIKQGDKEIVAVPTKDGRVYLLDAAALGGADHKTPLFVSDAYSNGKTEYAPEGLAAWQDADHANWLAVPFAGTAPSGVAGNGRVVNGGLVALKVTDNGGKVSLAPAWVSEDMLSPLPPLVVNGVVFGASSGEYYPAAGKTMSASERAKQSVPAIVYALDSSTGKQLWASKDAVTSFATTGMWSSLGQVYVATYDDTVYAFGFPMSRYVTTDGQ